MTTLIKNIYNGDYNKYLFMGVVGLFGLYSFFIVGAVVAVNQRKDMRTDIRTIQASVSDLEIHYFDLASQIDMQKAQQMGFVNEPVPTFAYSAGQDDKVAMSR
jgi:hypothetical protein